MVEPIANIRMATIVEATALAIIGLRAALLCSRWLLKISKSAIPHAIPMSNTSPAARVQKVLPISSEFALKMVLTFALLDSSPVKAKLRYACRTSLSGRSTVIPNSAIGRMEAAAISFAVPLVSWP